MFWLGPLRPAGVVALTLLVATLRVTAASHRTAADPSRNAAGALIVCIAARLTIGITRVLRTVATAEVFYIRRRCSGRFLLPSLLAVLVDDLVRVTRVWAAAAGDTRNHRRHLAPMHPVQPVKVAWLLGRRAQQGVRLDYSGRVWSILVICRLRLLTDLVQQLRQTADIDQRPRTHRHGMYWCRYLQGVAEAWFHACFTNRTLVWHQFTVREWLVDRCDIGIICIIVICLQRVFVDHRASTHQKPNLRVKACSAGWRCSCCRNQWWCNWHHGSVTRRHERLYTTNVTVTTNSTNFSIEIHFMRRHWLPTITQLPSDHWLLAG